MNPFDLTIWRIAFVKPSSKAAGAGEARLEYRLHGPQLEEELCGSRDVPMGAAAADHRVVLDGLEALAPLEPAVLVRLQVEGPVRDGTRVERCGDALEAAAEDVDERFLASLGEERERMLPELER